MNSSKVKRWSLWTLVNLSRLVLAVTFIFSGVVKLIDPRGTEYKIQDYAEAFGLSSLLPEYAPLILSVILALFEFMMGIYMLFGSRRLRTSRLLLAFMLVVTPFTLYLALKNPVHDCGCFGDAWVLTNWQTFWKNVILLAAACMTACHPRLMTRFISERNHWMISLYSSVFGLALALICIYRLPIMDFRPYHIGADILEEMSLSGADEAQYETYFLMEKDGKRQEFTTANYPDSTWTLVDTRTEQIGGSQDVPLITDLEIQTLETGEDITQSLLEEPGYKFLLIAPYLEQADDGVMDRIAALYDYCRDYGYPFYCLTASGEKAILHWQDITGADYPFCHTDAIVLKTMIRSNPGLMLLSGSKVVNKWPNRTLPRQEELNAPLEKLELAHPSINGYMRRLLNLLLWYVIPLLLWTLADRLGVAWDFWKEKKREQG